MLGLKTYRINQQRSSIYIGPLLDKYSGAVAAYSLRELSSNWENQPVVRVRRSLDNAELDFTATEITDGTMNSWINNANTVNGFNTPVADHDSGAILAFSFRYVTSDYSGPVARIRRSSDNVEQDFFPNQIINGELESFCGANDGYLVKWYNQKGGQDIEMSVASQQPQLVSSGTLLKKGGIPKLKINTGQLLVIPNFDQSQFVDGNIARISNFFIASVNTVKEFGNNMPICTIDFGTNSIRVSIQILQSTDAIRYYVNNTTNINGLGIGWQGKNTSYVTEYIIDNSGGQPDATLRLFTDNFFTSSKFIIPSNPDEGIPSGWAVAGIDDVDIQEIIVYNEYDAAFKEDIVANQYAYYEPDPLRWDGFVVRWYDQSGNTTDITQTTLFLQPTFVTSGTLNTSNGKPAIFFPYGTNRINLFRADNDGAFDFIDTFSVCAVWETTDVSSNNLMFIKGVNNYQVDGWYINGNTGSLAVNRAGVQVGVFVGPVITSGVINVGAYSVNSGHGRVIVNGTLGENDDIISTQNDQKFSIGDYMGINSDLNYGGHVFEGVFYKDLAINEREVYAIINNYYR